MSRSSIRHRKGKISYSVVVDGKTEVWYFQMMKKYEKLHRIDIVPEIPKNKSLSEQFKTVLENSNYYDKVFWIIDLDTIIKENKERRKNTVSGLDKIKKYIKEINNHYSGVVKVFINNPCLEYWFLLHFIETGKYFHNCEKVIKELKRTELTDYEKKERYFKRRNLDIYFRLKPHQKRAIKYALKQGLFSFDNHEKSISEMYLVLDELLKK